MVVAGGVPDPVPARHARERVLRAAFRLLEQILVVLLRGRELLRRRLRFERGTEAPTERPGLRERDSGQRGAEHEEPDTDPRTACDYLHVSPSAQVRKCLRN